jgi:hypothetical protein
VDSSSVAPASDATVSPTQARSKSPSIQSVAPLSYSVEEKGL